MTQTTDALRRRSAIYCRENDEHVELQWDAVEKLANFVALIDGNDVYVVERAIETMIERGTLEFVMTDGEIEIRHVEMVLM